MIYHVLVRIDLQPDRVEPNGPVERLDDGSPDVLAIVEHKIRQGFALVRGFDRVTVERIES